MNKAIYFFIRIFFRGYHYSNNSNQLFMSDKHKTTHHKKKTTFASLHKPPKKSNSIASLQRRDYLFESLEDLPFRNKEIKQHLKKQHHTKNSLSGGDSSTRIHEDKKPYGEYYGSETSIFTHRQHRSTELHPIKRSASHSKKN